MVYLSQLHSAKESPVRFLQYPAVVEEAIASSGMEFTHLRPNLYMHGLLGFRASIASENWFFAPIGDTGKHCRRSRYGGSGRRRADSNWS